MINNLTIQKAHPVAQLVIVFYSHTEGRLLNPRSRQTLVVKTGR